jgi:hypothetical protein
MIPNTKLQAEDMIYEDKGAGLCVLCVACARAGEVGIRDWVASIWSVLDLKLHSNLCQPNVVLMRKCMIANALCMAGCTYGLGNVYLGPVKGNAETLWHQAFNRFASASVCVPKIVESPPSLSTSIHSSPSQMLYFRSSPPDMLYYPSRPSMLYNQSSSKTFTS